jgi:hypothetical protein
VVFKPVLHKKQITMQKQLPLVILLVFMTLAVFILTVLAFQREGAGLFRVFIGNIRAAGWNGQFNADFSSYLTLSGLWIMWRNRFTASSIILGLAAMILGIIVFAPYILFSLNREKGDLGKVLLGDRFPQ